LGGDGVLRITTECVQATTIKKLTHKYTGKKGEYKQDLGTDINKYFIIFIRTLVRLQKKDKGI